MRHMLRMLQRGLHGNVPQCAPKYVACHTRPASAAFLPIQRQWIHQPLIADKPWGCSRLASTGSDTPVIAGQDSASRPHARPASVTGDGCVDVDVDVCVEGELEQHSRCCMGSVASSPQGDSGSEHRNQGLCIEIRMVRRQSIEQLRAAVGRDAALVVQAAVPLVASSAGD
jgi:hypothetical protein